MNCPYCSEGSTKVVDTRDTSENEVRRRRECQECGERFTTYERVGSPSLRVVKQNGEEEPFKRDKVRDGIERACNKRPISDEEIEDIVDQVESELRSRDARTVDADEIGDLVMERLKDMDEVAYMRFASVYRDFEDADSFKDELEQLEQDENS